ncbi:MAG: HEAT repeat domain-containing protein [Planctomycetes bacterium]|nr:HEAT repeat domain-containing protein [Planctomycetota bacterium]
MRKSIIHVALAAAVLSAGARELCGQDVATTPNDQEPQLIAVLKSDAPQKEKVDACRKLALVGTENAVPALAALLGDEKLSHMARYALEPIPSPAVDDALRDAMGNLKGRPLIGAIASIGVRRDAKAVPLLVKMLQDADSVVVRTTARALGKIGTPEAGEALKQALAKTPDASRLAVADACLGCAEALLDQGQRAEAATLYNCVGNTKLPKHFRVAAMRGAILAKESD